MGLSRPPEVTLGDPRAPDKAVGDLLSDQPVPDVVRGEHGQRGYEARLRNQPALLTAGVNGDMYSAELQVVLGDHAWGSAIMYLQMLHNYAHLRTKSARQVCRTANKPVDVCKEGAFDACSESNGSTAERKAAGSGGSKRQAGN